MASVQIFHGDSLAIVPTLNLDPKTTAVLSDPPYGCNNDCDYTRFRGGLSPSRNFHKGIANDDRPFDPSPWLSFHKVILWGYQFFADKLPQGTILVWSKKRPNQRGKFLSDGEIAWQKGNKGVYLFDHVWHGFDRETERGEKTTHPAQKPVKLYDWCLDRLKLKPGDTVLDPYAGTAACGVACVRRGINYIGIELDEGYFGIAKERLEKEANAAGSN